MDKLQAEQETQCSVPGCCQVADFISPGNWCVRHWEMWFGWPDGREEPRWMKGKEGLEGNESI